MDIQFTSWYNETPNLASLLAFGTKGYVFQNRSETNVVKEIILMTLLVIFVSIRSPATLYRSIVLTLQSIKICRKYYFTILKEDLLLPWFQTLTTRISQDLMGEEGDRHFEKVPWHIVLDQRGFPRTSAKASSTSTWNKITQRFRNHSKKNAVYHTEPKPMMRNTTRSSTAAFGHIIMMS